MRKLIFITFLVLLMAPQVALGCSNYKQLDGHAGRFATKLWSRILVLEPELREAVQCLPLRTDIDKDHFSSENFYKLWGEQRNQIQDGQFHYFTSLCKNVYETCDEMDKIRVFVILSHVSSEYGKNFKLLQRNYRTKDQKPEFESELSFSDIMGMFNRTTISNNSKLVKNDSEFICDWSYKEEALKLYAKKLHEQMRTNSKPIPYDDIRQKLNFMYKLDEREKSNIDRKYYFKPTTFQIYFEGVTANISGERFLTFAVTCKQLYDELKEFQDKLALFLLLEQVAENEKTFLWHRKLQRDREELKADAYFFELPK